MISVKQKILFICTENACRSQIAEGIAKLFWGNELEIYSAGSNPSNQIDPNAIEVMKEIKIDISNQSPKGFDKLPVSEFGYVITLGCRDRCPSIPSGKHIHWNITDPKNKSIKSFRKARDKIKIKLFSLMDKIKKGIEKNNFVCPLTSELKLL